MNVGRDIDGLEIRAPRREEFPEIVGISDLGFGEETPPEDYDELSRSFPWDRALCAYDHGRAVGVLAAYSLELTLPGRVSLPAGALSWGATLPTHRRRGILRALLSRLTDDMVRRDEPLSVLMASEASIYPRFGYGPATTMMSFSIDRVHAGFVASPNAVTPKGLTLVEGAEAAELLPVIYDSVRMHQPGALSRPAQWWAHYLQDPPRYREGATRLYHVVHRDPDGVADGYLSYRIKEKWVAATPLYEALVAELIAGTPDTYSRLWRYILDTDLCQTISCQHGRPDEPLRRLLADSRRLHVGAVADDLYLRLLDIPRALASRAYAVPGELVLEVTQTFPLPTTARYLLVTGAPGGGTECHLTDRAADIVLTADILAAAYLGGVSFSNLAAAGRVQTINPSRLVLADAMFAWGIAPYCATMF